MKSQEKFREDKTYKYFPGMAIIHFINDLETKNILSTITDKMKESSLFDKYVFLPESSFHSTISDLLTYNNLSTNPDFNQFELKDEKDETIIDDYVKNRLKDTLFKLNVNMEVTVITARKIHLKPKTEEDRIKLRDFRIYIAELLHISYDDVYQFHISLSYQLQHRTDKERENIKDFLDKLNKEHVNLIDTIQMDICELVTFNTMSEFVNAETKRAVYHKI